MLFLTKIACSKIHNLFLKIRRTFRNKIKRLSTYISSVGNMQLSVDKLQLLALTLATL